MILPFEEHHPVVDPEAWVEDSARVIGRVVLGPEASVWFHTVVRGDGHDIRIGARTNLQDLVTVHITTDLWPTLVGDDVTVGHRAILHGCRLGDRCLIGMGAIVMDGVELGADCLVAAGSVVVPGTKVGDGQVLRGSPARVVRAVTEEERQQFLESARAYVDLARRYRHPS